MNAEFPNDADGDALRRVAESGADFSRPMRIEFSIAVPSLEQARAVAEAVSQHGYDPDTVVGDDTNTVSVYCARTMLASYEAVVSAQEYLNQVVAMFGAECDGWATYGNIQG